MKKATQKVQTLPLEYSDKAVTPWGGLRFVQQLINKKKLTEFPETLPLPKPGSNRE